LIALAEPLYNGDPQPLKVHRWCPSWSTFGIQIDSLGVFHVFRFYL